MRADITLQKVAKKIGASFVFDNWAGANVSLDNVSFPAVIYILPASGSFNLDKGWIKDNQNSMIAFLDKTNFQTTGEENGSVIDNMKDLAKKFFIELNKTNIYQSIGGILPYRVVYDTFDVNVAGITFEIPLKEVTGICEKNI